MSLDIANYMLYYFHEYVKNFKMIRGGRAIEI